MFERNRLLQMLEARQLPLGIQCFTGDPALIEVLGQTGFDFVMLDCEHSGANPRSMEDLVRVSRLAGLAPYVRVPDPRAGADVHRALEAGAEGIFLPEVHGVADIRRRAAPRSSRPRAIAASARRSVPRATTPPRSATTPRGTTPRSRWCP